MIDRLDIPVPSVLLECEIVELSDTAARNIGLDFSPDGSGIVVNGASTAGSSAAAGSTGNGYTVHSLQTGTGGFSFGANLYAQISEGNGRVLSKPRILAQSGQQASILTGDAIPIFTSVTAANVGVSSQVNYINVGVNLQIAPRVSSDGIVTSHIFSDVSSVTGYTNNAPQISQRTTSTLASVKDGEAFVIGGLLQDNETRSLSKLPFIGDLPIIGVLFRHVSTTKQQTNLYIVVTPHIIQPGAASVFTPVSTPLSSPAPLPQSSGAASTRFTRAVSLRYLVLAARSLPASLAVRRTFRHCRPDSRRRALQTTRSAHNRHPQHSHLDERRARRRSSDGKPSSRGGFGGRWERSRTGTISCCSYRKAPRALARATASCACAPPAFHHRRRALRTGISISTYAIARRIAG